jgi:hypothetical protein
MKRSSSSLGQQSTNNNDESHQTTYAKVAQQPSSRSRYNYEEKNDYRRQQTSMDQHVVRQDLLCSLDGIFLYQPAKFQLSSFSLF